MQILQTISYIFAVMGVRFDEGLGKITTRQADYKVALLDIKSKITTDFDAAKAVKDFMKKYDNSSVANDTNELVDSFIKNRPAAAALLTGTPKIDREARIRYYSSDSVTQLNIDGTED